MKSREALLSLDACAKGTAPMWTRICTSVESGNSHQVSFFLESPEEGRFTCRVICHGFEKILGRDNRFIAVWGEVLCMKKGWEPFHVREIPDKTFQFITAIIDSQSPYPYINKHGPCVAWLSSDGGLYHEYRSIRRRFIDKLKEVDD